MGFKIISWCGTQREPFARSVPVSWKKSVGCGRDRGVRGKEGLRRLDGTMTILRITTSVLVNCVVTVIFCDGFCIGDYCILKLS